MPWVFGLVAVGVVGFIAYSNNLLCGVGLCPAAGAVGGEGLPAPGGTPAQSQNITITFGAQTWPVAVPPGASVTFLPPPGVTAMPTVSNLTGGASSAGDNVVTLTSPGGFTLTWFNVVGHYAYDGANLAPAAAPAASNPITFNVGEQYLFTLTYSDAVAANDYKSALALYLNQLEDMGGNSAAGVFTVSSVRSGTGKAGRGTGSTILAYLNCAEDITLNIVPMPPNGNNWVTAIGVVDNGPSVKPDKTFQFQLGLMTSGAVTEGSTFTATLLNVPLDPGSYATSDSTVADLTVSPGVFQAIGPGVATISATSTGMGGHVHQLDFQVTVVGALSGSIPLPLDGTPLYAPASSGTVTVQAQSGQAIQGVQVDGTGVTSATVTASGDQALLALSGQSGSATVLWDMGGTPWSTPINFASLS